MVFGYGDGGTGCDVCASNLIRFWCHATCSPDQKSFYKMGNIFERKDPET